jgi:hypothetical protein
MSRPNRLSESESEDGHAPGCVFGGPAMIEVSLHLPSRAGARPDASASFHVWALMPALIIIGMLLIIGIGVAWT